MFDYYIFGLQRSGTTFFERLLTNTFNARWLNGAGTWKHELHVPDVIWENKYTAFVSFKNPYTWMESIIFREHAGIILTATEYGLQEDTGPGSVIWHDGINIANTAKLYAAYAERWLAAADKGCVHVIRYEDMLTQQGKDMLATHLNLGRGIIDWNVPEPGSLFMSEGFSANIIPYYLNMHPTWFTADQVKTINENIPDDIFTRLGYYKIT